MWIALGAARCRAWFRRCASGSALAALLLATGPALAQVVANPIVSGPVAATAAPGHPSRNYIFFASQFDLAARGYVEEEYFIEGTASTFTTPALATGAVVSSGHPYRTRIVVRRPVSPARFNGTVLVEWTNVTNNMDMENTWFQIYEHVMRSGYAWVGVSAQRAGVNRLRGWNSDRYGALDLSQRDANGVETITNDALSYDVYSQAVQALRSPQGVDPLGGLPRDGLRVIATGHSQSAMRLAAYVNSIHPLARVVSGYALHGSLSNPIRSDLEVPVWKVLSEYDVRALEARVRRPDDTMFVTWEVTGTSHNDFQSYQSRTFLQLRDIGSTVESALNCSFMPPGSKVPFHHAMAAGLEHLVAWTRGGPPVPSAPPLDLQLGPPVVLNLDPLGLALGGVRLPQVAVPIAVSSGTNIGPGSCDRWGYTQPFDTALLASLYPTHASYVTPVRGAALAYVAAGYLVEADAQQTIAEAEASMVGRALGDVTGDDLVDCRDLHAASAVLGRRAGEAGFVLAADVDANGYIDVRDIAAISRVLPPGTHCPAPLRANRAAASGPAAPGAAIKP